MQKKLNRIYDSHMAFVLFGLCWLVYFASYIGRLNYSSAMPAMINESVLNTSQAGFISMAYFFAYGIGQFCNGILADRVHPGKMIFFGLFVSGVLNLCMGLASGFGIMAVLWCANGYMQAMIWPPIMRIFAEMMTAEKKVKYCVHITSTMALGTLASYLLSAAMISISGWRFVFYGAALCMCLAALIFLVRFGKVEEYAGKSEAKEQIEAVWNPQKSGGKNKTSEPFGKLLITSGLFFILIPVVVHGVLKDGVTSWVPTYISETFQTTPAFSILVTTLLPVINLTGAYAANFMYRRFFKQQEVKTAFFFFLTAAGALFLLWKFSSRSILLTVLLFSVITASMMAVNTLFVNLLPLRFEQAGRVSTVSGFLNAMAYLGSACSTFTIGLLVQNTGWDMTILSWVLITGIAALSCYVLRNKTFRFAA